MTYTRQQYLDKACTHRQFYGQFVGPGVIRTVENFIGVDSLRASKDSHFNDIPLGRWDRLADLMHNLTASKVRATGDVPTLSGAVCIAKEAAHQILEARA